MYDVTASGGNLAGLNATVTLGFAGGQNIADLADNALSNTAPTGTDESAYVIDNTAPGVTISDVPARSSSAFTARFSFSEPVTGFVVGDISVGNGAAGSFTPVTADQVWTAEITPSAEGEVTIDVAAAAATDAAGNPSTAATQATSVYDTSAPGVASIVHQTPGSSPTNADSVTWRVTFSKDVKNVDAADFTVSGTTAQLNFSEVTASRVYDVTASGGNLAGLNATVTLGFAGGQNIADLADNALSNTAPTGTDESAYVIDNTAPGVASIVHQTPGSSPTNADSVTWRVTFSEDVKNVNAADFTVSGTTAQLNFSEVTASRVYDVTASGGNLAGLNATVTLGFAGGQNIADLADNALSDTAPTGTDESAYVIDNTAPGVASIVHQTPGSSPTNADSVTWRVTFSEDVKNVNAADFTVSGTTAQLSVSQVTASRVYDVTASGGNLAGLNATVTLGFAGGQNIADLADNALSDTAPTGTDESAYVIDNTAPGIASIVHQTPGSSPTNADSVTWRVTFSKDVKNVDAADFTVSGTTAQLNFSEVTASRCMT